VQKLNRDVGGIAARAAIAHGEQAPVAAVDVSDRPGGVHHGLTVSGKKVRKYVLMMPRLLSHRLDKRCVQGVRIWFPAMQERIERLQTFVMRHGRTSFTRASGWKPSAATCHSHGVKLRLDCPEFFQNLQRRRRLLLVDTTHGEADMDKYPIADAHIDRVIIADDAHQINLAPDTCHIDDTERVIRIRYRDNLSGNA
jgi:hypothetical protein